jgi:Phytanoyl-CoA dioxygenase (PhyH)
VGNPRITDEQVAEWRKHGFVVIPDFLTPAELTDARENVRRYFPTWDEYEAAPHRYEGISPWREFPFVGDTLNNLTTHPDLIAFVEAALGTEDIFITQSLIWGKYAGRGDWDQELHVDFGNNTLVVPRDDGEFRQVPMILYFEDVDVSLGPTHVVSQTVTEPRQPLPMRLPDGPAEIHAEEQPVTVTAGSLMVYSMRTYHRGSRITATAGARFTQHIVWRRAGYEWMGWRAFPREAREPAFVRFVEQATPRQRTVIGFPAPGHPYWNDDTLDGVARRYPGMDMAPYRSALPRP